MDSNQNHARILEHSGHGIIATDKKGRIVFINTRAQRHVAVGNKSLLGRQLADIFPHIEALLTRALKTGKAQMGNQVKGENGPLMIHINPVTEGKTAIGVVCNLIDAAQLERFARRLDFFNTLDRKFKTVFDASSDGMWICDKQGRVVDINKATEKLGGIRREDMLGRRVSEIVREGLYDKYVTDEVIRTKRVVSQLQKIKNTNKTVLCTGIPVLDENDNVSAVVINERDITQLHAIQQQLEEIRGEKDRYKAELIELSMEQLRQDKFVAESEKMRQVIKTAIKFAHIGVSDILLLGESGTGKGLLAKFIHNCSPRAKKPFIQINCAAIPESILEAELFGYEKGAFTGARVGGKPGLFELSNEGTLFLDEIGEMPLAVQAKILKYLDDHEIMRLGGTTTKRIDSVLIAATNQNLQECVATGRFRQDLYYRLNSLILKIPPLRERPEDIFALTNHFLQHFNQKYTLDKKINPLTVALLQSYSFPGNVRELRNIIKQATFMSDGDKIDNVIIHNIRKDVLDEWSQLNRNRQHINGLKDIVLAFEKEIIRNAMRHCRSTRDIARYLNISQPTAVRKLKKHGFSFR